MHIKSLHFRSFIATLCVALLLLCNTHQAHAQWSELGGINALAANGYTQSMCADAAGNIYAAGYFTNSSNNQYVAKYNGSTWSELGGSNALAANSNIISICADAAGNIYAAGYFTNSSGNFYVAKYNGSTWSELGGSNALAPNNSIHSICADAAGNIYAAGYFTNSSGNYYVVAKYNGSTWSELGGSNALGANSSIRSICADAAGNIYAAGNFINSSNKQYVAKYNGSTWSELGGSNALAANNSINSIRADAAGNIYAAGYFTNSSGNYYVAKYNGSTWSELGGSNALAANSNIFSICADAAGNIYAAGFFTNSSYNTYVAKYNGSTWSELGGSNALAPNNIIYSICADAAGNIYAAGFFTNIFSNYYVAKYTASTPFITTWNTNNAGTSNSTSITIPTTGSGYSYDVDWNNDGTYDDFAVTGSITHNYGTAGTYTVAIRGSFPRIFFNYGGDRLKILSINAWGSIAWTSMVAAFEGCSNLTIPATDAPNLTNVTDMSYMFELCTSFNQPFASTFNTSNVNNMAGMFYGCTAYNQALPSSFNTSAVTNMSSMFAACTAFNQALPSSFNTSAVTNMNGMFYSCTAFNQALPSSFNTSAVTNMNGMFNGCSVYNQALPASFNTSAVNNMAGMFYGCSAYNQALPSSFNTSAVTNMGNMFNGCSAYNQALPSSFNTSAVTNMSYMFYNCTAFNQNIGNWNIGAATNMVYIFYNSGITQATYDSILIRWNNAGYTNKNLGNASPLKYCAGAAARASLITKGWTITGDALLCPVVVCTPNSSTQSTSVCAAAFPYTYFGKTFTATHLTDTLKRTNYKGCDSLVNLKVSVNYPTYGYIRDTICSTDSVLFKGHYYQQSGTYQIHLTNHFGCDSLVYLTIKTLPQTLGYITQTICSTDSFVYHGKSYKIHGTYKIHLTNHFGCDSVMFLTINIKPQTYGYINQTICSTDSFAYRSKWYKVHGTYQIHLTNHFGCDSVMFLTINIKPQTYGYINQTICSTDSFAYRSKWYKVHGTYQIHLTNHFGCDSLVFLTIKTLPQTLGYITQTICSTDSFAYRSKWYKVHGTYQIHLTNHFGCDSLVFLTIKTLPQTLGYITQTICSTDSFAYRSKWYKVHGTYQIHLTNHFGCDSLVFLTINIKPQTYGYINQTICSTDSFAYRGKWYKVHGTYQIHLTNHFGCDSVVFLTINYGNSSSSQYDTFCLVIGAYHWNGQTYNAAGHYAKQFTNYKGCDSIANLYLTAYCSTRMKKSLSDNENNNPIMPSFNLYPNPTNNSFTIETNCVNCGKMKIEVMNMQGQMMYATEMDNSEGRMLIAPNLDAGMYFVKVTSLDKTYQQMKSVVISK